MFSLRQCCIIQFDCTSERPVLPEILFFTYKAKATNVVLESKAKAKDSHQGQGQGQTITRPRPRPRPQILSLRPRPRPRTNITALQGSLGATSQTISTIYCPDNIAETNTSSVFVETPNRDGADVMFSGRMFQSLGNDRSPTVTSRDRGTTKFRGGRRPETAS